MSLPTPKAIAAPPGGATPSPATSIQRAVDDLVAAIEALQAENAELRAQLEERPAPREATDPEALATAHAAALEELSDLEHQNSNFLSLYVASSQLHATLVLEDVLTHVKEVILNLIGADAFAIYLYDPGQRELRLSAVEGPGDIADEAVPYGDNAVSHIVASGELYLASEASEPVAFPSGAAPLAMLPLVIDGAPVGVIAIFRLLVQKTSFGPFDLELFELLAAHAASALRSAQAYRVLERKTKTLQGLLDLFKDGGYQVLATRVAPGES